jgi:vacuolar-type H+-ATPase subunit E/Vma4
MDKNTLESSIKAESERAIAVIKEKEAAEIKRLDEIFATEMDGFRKEAKADTEARLQQELSKISNKATLERRKLRLTSLEDFINRTVDEVVKNLRKNLHYKQFLINVVCDAAGGISGVAEVHLKSEDLVLEKEILEAIKAKCSCESVFIKGDPGIKWGGCLVLDDAGSRIFNNTIERIYLRKSLMIRRKVMKMLMDASQDKK